MAKEEETSLIIAQDLLEQCLENDLEIMIYLAKLGLPANIISTNFDKARAETEALLERISKGI